MILFASPLWAQDVRRFLLLVDYIGSDYAAAVKDGAVVNPDEYQEMQAFIADATSLFDSLTTPQAGSAEAELIRLRLQRLRDLIENRAEPSDVAALAKEIKDATVTAYQVTTFPLSSPSLERGKTLYHENCAACHGVDGGAQTPLARGLTPPPTNFRDASVMENLSPFKAFNVLSFGITGTAMASFDALSEEDRWHLAFYPFTLRFSRGDADRGRGLWREGLSQELRDLKVLSSLSDGDLLERLTGAGIAAPDERQSVLAFLRTDLTKEPGLAPLPYAMASVGKSIDLVRAGKVEEAYQVLLEGYLEGFELAEPELQASQPERMVRIERMFLTTRRALKDKDETKSLALLEELRAQLEQAQSEMIEGAPSPYVSFVNSFIIILREGMEAALIVAAILAFLRSTGQPTAVTYVHLGWIGAIVASLATWVIAEFLIAVSGSNRELIEGIASLAAAAALFYVSYWLLAKLEAKKWADYIRSKIQTALSTGHMTAMAGVAFLAVYREGFETVLFYQALIIQSGSQQAYVWLGFILGLAVLAVVVYAIFKLGLKVPLRYFFGLTSGLLYALAIVLAGEGVYRLQQVALLHETPVDLTPVPTLGIYPNAEGLLIQAVMVLLFLGSLLWFLVLAPKRGLSPNRS